MTTESAHKCRVWSSISCLFDINHYNNSDALKKISKIYSHSRLSKMSKTKIPEKVWTLHGHYSMDNRTLCLCVCVVHVWNQTDIEFDATQHFVSTSICALDINLCPRQHTQITQYYHLNSNDQPDSWYGNSIFELGIAKHRTHNNRRQYMYCVCSGWLFAHEEVMSNIWLWPNTFTRKRSWLVRVTIHKLNVCELRINTPQRW